MNTRTRTQRQTNTRGQRHMKLRPSTQAGQCQPNQLGSRYPKHPRNLSPIWLNDEELVVKEANTHQESDPQTQEHSLGPTKKKTTQELVGWAPKPRTHTACATPHVRSAFKGGPKTSTLNNTWMGLISNTEETWIDGATAGCFTEGAFPSWKPLGQ